MAEMTDEEFGVAPKAGGTMSDAEFLGGEASTPASSAQQWAKDVSTVGPNQSASVFGTPVSKRGSSYGETLGQYYQAAGQKIKEAAHGIYEATDPMRGHSPVETAGMLADLAKGASGLASGAVAPVTAATNPVWEYATGIPGEAAVGALGAAAPIRGAGALNLRPPAAPPEINPAIPPRGSNLALPGTLQRAPQVDMGELERAIAEPPGSAPQAPAPAAPPQPERTANLLPPETPHTIPSGRASVGAAGAPDPLAGLSPETVEKLSADVKQAFPNEHMAEQALDESSAHHMFGELDPALEHKMSGLAATTGPERTEISNAVFQRAQEATERVRASFDRAFGANQDRATLRRTMDIDRDRAAAPFWQQYDRTVVPPFPQLVALTPRLEAAGALQAANKSLRIEGLPTVTRWARPSGEDLQLPTARAYQYAKEHLDDKIERAIANPGGMNEARRLTQLKNALVSAIDNHPDPDVAGIWKAARDVWATPERIKNAMSVGERILTGHIHPDELPFMTASYGTAEMAALRTGMRGYLEDMFGRPGPQTRKLINTVLAPANQRKIQWAIGDRQAEELRQAIAHEASMHDAPTRIIRGSPTAGRQAAREEWNAPESRLETIAGEVPSAIHHPIRTAAKAAVNTVFRRQAERRATTAARVREEAARIYTLQGAERNAAVRALLNVAVNPRRASGFASGGRVGSTRAESHYGSSRGKPERHCGPDRQWPTGFCQHYRSPHRCTEVAGVIATKGSCDWFRAAARASGGRAMADGGDPGDEQTAAQDAAEAAAARVRAPYAAANARTSGLPDVGTVLGNKFVNTLMAGPNLMGQVAHGEVDPNSEEGIRRSADVAAGTLGYGMMGARPGAAGMAGGRLAQPAMEAAEKALPPNTTPGILHMHSQIAGMGPEWQNVPVIDHTGKVIHNPINSEHVNGPMLMMDKDGNLSPGILAYHGSPHDFDRFDLSKIGTGEGAQAYGHGLYFAENEGVAADYKKALGRSYAQRMLDRHNGDFDAAITDLKRNANSSEGRMFPEALDQLVAAKGGEPLPHSGKMYQVAIKAPPEHFLDWDKPLSEQSPKVRDILKGIPGRKLTGDPVYDAPYRDKLSGQEFYRTLAREHGANTPGSANWKGAEAPDARTAAALREAGIPGIRYLDQGSRLDPAAAKADLDQARAALATVEKQPAGPQRDQRLAQLRDWHDKAEKAHAYAVNPTRNYVVFSDDLIHILKKYGIAGLGALPAMNAYHFQDEGVQKKAAGGRAMADGGDPGDEQAATQDAAEAAAARVRAPYAKANERESGLPQLGEYYGNKIASALTAPRDALYGNMAVTDTEGMPTPDAMQRAQGVANMAMTGGFGTTAVRGSEPAALGIVPVPVAKRLNVETAPVSDLLRKAVEGTPGAKIDEDGHLIMNVVRHQSPMQEGEESVRHGVFYLPTGNKNMRHYNGTTNNNYGGNQRIEGETAFKNPLLVKGATGGKAPQMAMDSILGKGAYKAMDDDAFKAAFGPRKMQDELIEQFLEKHAPDMIGLGNYIAKNSSKGNQLPYALKEAAVAHVAREAGHDGVVGYSVKRDGTPFLSEVFDVRESHYPDTGGGYGLHPKFQTERASGGRVEPTDAQKEAGNYKKRHVTVHGLPIAIENSKGSERSGVGKDGKRWAVKMPAHYGYLKRTEGADGDHVDCYVGQYPQSRKVFIVDQKDAETGKFDEHKCMLGFGSAEMARQHYLRGFSDGKGKQRLGHIREMSIDDFKHWLRNGDTTRPAKAA